MIEVPKVVIRSDRVKNIGPKEFNFGREMIRFPRKSKYLCDYRSMAWESFRNSEFPSKSNESWRRTDLNALRPELFNFPVADNTKPAQIPNTFSRAPGETNGLVQSCHGVAKVKISQELEQQGVIFTDLQTAEKEYPAVLEKVMGKLVRPDESKFAALAAAFAQDGILLYVPAGVQVTLPLYSQIWNSDGNTVSVSHSVILLEDKASATFVSEMSSRTDSNDQRLHAGLVEIVVGQNATLNFMELQNWGENVWNFTHEKVKLERNSTINWSLGALGSKVSKSNLEMILAGPGSHGQMSGIYFAAGRQHLDYETKQRHMASNTTSNLVYKGVLKGQSRSVWRGMVYVAPEADKSDGYQINRNLLLSDMARADSIPGLEILANDVRCSHGASVGRLDEEQMFYLLSRGIPKPTAEKLIVEGYFDPVINKFPIESIRRRCLSTIRSKMI